MILFQWALTIKPGNEKKTQNFDKTELRINDFSAIAQQESVFTLPGYTLNLLVKSFAHEEEKGLEQN